MSEVHLCYFKCASIDVKEVEESAALQLYVQYILGIQHTIPLPDKKFTSKELSNDKYFMPQLV